MENEAEEQKRVRAKSFLSGLSLSVAILNRNVGLIENRNKGRHLASWHWIRIARLLLRKLESARD
jgi:hypothetical protein